MLSRKSTIAILLLFSNYYTISNVNGSRADLGTYLHIAPSAVDEKPPSTSSSSSSPTNPEDLYVLAFINYTYVSDGREVYYSEEKGRYGEGKILNVQGYLEHITSVDDFNDHTACTPHIRGTNGHLLPALGSGKPWIALIKRGKCTFEEKIKYAWKHGAVGVIVYNEIPAVSLEKMKIIEKERNITAIFTYKWIGEELGRIVDEGNHIWVSISEGQRGMKPQHNINKTSVLFVSISFIVLMIISLVWLIFYYIQRFRYLQSKDQHSRHLCAVAKRVIMKIPTKSGKNEDKDGEGDCCAICIEPYKATDCIRVLPCNHEFHKNCIDPWLLEHRTCPMCKLDVLKHYGFVYIGSEESIIQLDLDMEIGDHGINSGDSDHFNLDTTTNQRIHHRAMEPTFHIQTFDDQSHLVSNLSPTSFIGRHLQVCNNLHNMDELPERSQSSLSCINHMLDETIGSKLFSLHNQNHNNSGDNSNMSAITSIGTSRNDSSKQVIASKCIATTTMNSNFLNPNSYKREMESISLPGTLKKKKSSTNSCRGSNNCYVKTATSDLKQLASKLEKGCPKSHTFVINRHTSDNEHLLNSIQTIEPIENDPPIVLGTASSSTAESTLATTVITVNPLRSIPKIQIENEDPEENENTKYQRL